MTVCLALAGFVLGLGVAYAVSALWLEALAYGIGYYGWHEYWQRSRHH